MCIFMYSGILCVSAFIVFLCNTHGLTCPRRFHFYSILFCCTTAGIFHYQKNKGCATAQFQISFPVPNPGTLPATFMIATMPAALQQTFFGTTYTMEQVSPFLSRGLFLMMLTCWWPPMQDNDISLPI